MVAVWFFDWFSGCLQVLALASLPKKTAAMWVQFCCRLVGVGSAGRLAIAIIGQIHISFTAHFAGNCRKHQKCDLTNDGNSQFFEGFLRKGIGNSEKNQFLSQASGSSGTSSELSKALQQNLQALACCGS